MQSSVLSFVGPEQQQQQSSSSREYSALTCTGISYAQLPFQASSSLITEGEELLQLLLDDYFHVELTHLIHNWYEDLGDSPVGGPLVKAAWCVTHDKMQSLRSGRSLNRLYVASQDIFVNSSQPLNMPNTAADGALERELSAMRWETIGIYYAVASMVLASRRRDGSHSTTRQWSGDCKATAHGAFDACLRCESLCNRVGQVNDLSMWFSVLLTTLATWNFGDNSCHAWRLMGGLASTIIALGYHKGTRDTANTPIYLKELRKRAVALSHELDKSLATFVSRPPRLNKSYCTVELPLDLADSVITGSVGQLESQISRLDGHGWNTDMNVYPASRQRAVIGLSFIREDVLELLLATTTPQDLIGKAE